MYSFEHFYVVCCMWKCSHMNPVLHFHVKIEHRTKTWTSLHKNSFTTSEWCACTIDMLLREYLQGDSRQLLSINCVYANCSALQHMWTIILEQRIYRSLVLASDAVSFHTQLFSSWFVTLKVKFRHKRIIWNM